MFPLTGKKLTTTHLRNFYVDDELKLVPLERAGLTVIQEAAGLCKMGVFKPTKLIIIK